MKYRAPGARHAVAARRYHYLDPVCIAVSGPMVAWLCVGALLWLQVDPTRELFPEVLRAESGGGRLVEEPC